MTELVANAVIAQSVERILGKDEVPGSNPGNSSNRNTTETSVSWCFCCFSHRNVPFRSLIFDNYSRSEAALVACMAEMVINDVSTRKVQAARAVFSKDSLAMLLKSEVPAKLIGIAEEPQRLRAA